IDDDLLVDRCSSRLVERPTLVRGPEVVVRSVYALQVVDPIDIDGTGNPAVPSRGELTTEVLGATAHVQNDGVSSPDRAQPGREARSPRRPELAETPREIFRRRRCATGAREVVVGQIGGTGNVALAKEVWLAYVYDHDSRVLEPPCQPIRIDDDRFQRLPPPR